jgi:hydrogenase-4 component B
MSLSLVAVGATLHMVGGMLALLLAARPMISRALAIGLGLAGSLACLVGALTTTEPVRMPLAAAAPYARLGLVIDPLAAWFVLVIAVVALPVGIAAFGYSRDYDHHGGPRMHAATGLFVASMLLVVVADGVMTFLVAWELMSLSSYFLVVHHDDDPEVRRAGFVYLVMTHIGTVALTGAFLMLAAAGGGLDFDALRVGAARLGPLARDGVFLLCIVGFGVKAGLIPLHVWLPRAHPVAPSHVSALMSGVMLKTAVYGLFRLVWDIMGGGPAWWGGLLLALGAVSAVLGILYALMESDLKRLLAFCSVENLGIIAIGIGAGLAAGGMGQPAIAAIGLGAALFHTLNHAIFKSLLFLAAGSVHHATGTKDVEKLGGLVRRMPWTGALFILGAAAISALPPLNGFASEWLTIQALLALAGAVMSTWSNLGVLVVGAMVALTGALAAACFVGAAGVAFLGIPRSDSAATAHETSAWSLLGMGVLAIGCVVLGVFPRLALGRIEAIVPRAVESTTTTITVGTLTTYSPLATLGAVVAIVAVAWLGARLLGSVPNRRGPAWACGFALEPRMQYGALAFAKPIRLFFATVLRPSRDIQPAGAGSAYFPTPYRYRAYVRPLFDELLYRPTLGALMIATRRARGIQGGSVRAYLGYVFATLVILLWLVRP